jgi:hypothetical protein
VAEAAQRRQEWIAKGAALARRRQISRLHYHLRDQSGSAPGGWRARPEGRLRSHRIDQSPLTMRGQPQPGATAGGAHGGFLRFQQARQQQVAARHQRLGEIGRG